MSKAYECDRCGLLFKRNMIRDYIRLRENLNKGDTTPSKDFQTRDLCNDCYESLKEWYDNDTN